MADWELGAPMTMRARVHLASVTKTFTGAAVVMLAERGKLSYCCYDGLDKWFSPSTERRQT